jgi:hypothetical protein
LHEIYDAASFAEGQWLYDRRAPMLALIFVRAVVAAGAPMTRVPSGRGNAVFVNGYIADGEWSDAATIALSDDHVLHIKQDRRFLYLAVAFPKATPHSGAELYFADEANVIQTMAGDDGKMKVLAPDRASGRMPSRMRSRSRMRA